MIDLTIAILTYEGDELLRGCLQALQGQDLPYPHTKELLIVDDHSRTPPQVIVPHRLVIHETNRGNIAGTNTCFREAQGAWVLFMANDVRLHPNCLWHLWEHRYLHSITQPVLMQPNGAIDNVGLRWHWPGYGSRVRRVGGRIEAFANTCYLMQRSTWDLVGGFDEGLGISHEDIDFSLRARALGFTIGYCAKARATHLMGQTIGRVVQRPLSPYYRAARRRTIERNYRGLNRWMRLQATGSLEALIAGRPPRSPGAPKTLADAPPLPPH